MISKELAIYLGERGGTLQHVSMMTSGRKPRRLEARINGKCKTWKREPDRWRLPMKHGLRECFYIGPGCHQNPSDWIYPPYEEARKERETASRDATFANVIVSWSFPGEDEREAYFPVLADRAEELGLMNLAHFLRAGILPTLPS